MGFGAVLGQARLRQPPAVGAQAIAKGIFDPKKAAAKKPVAEKSAAKKPVAKKAVAEKPAASSPVVTGNYSNLESCRPLNAIAFNEK